MAIAIRQDVIKQTHYQTLITRLTAEDRSNTRIQCSASKCLIEYLIYYDPVMSEQEARKVLEDRVKDAHPNHEQIITLDEPIPDEVKPLFR